MAHGEKAYKYKHVNKLRTGPVQAVQSGLRPRDLNPRCVHSGVVGLLGKWIRIASVLVPSAFLTGVSFPLMWVNLCEATSQSVALVCRFP